MALPFLKVSINQLYIWSSYNWPRCVRFRKVKKERKKGSLLALIDRLAKKNISFHPFTWRYDILNFNWFFHFLSLPRCSAVFFSIEVSSATLSFSFWFSLAFLLPCESNVFVRQTNICRSRWFRCRPLRRLYSRFAPFAHHSRSTRHRATTTAEKGKPSLAYASIKNERTRSSEERVHTKSWERRPNFEFTDGERNPQSSTTFWSIRIATAADDRSHWNRAQWRSGTSSGSVGQRQEQSDRRTLLHSATTSESEYRQIQSSESIIGLEQIAWNGSFSVLSLDILLIHLWLVHSTNGILMARKRIKYHVK